MSKKTLNKANLSALGADRLADLLLEVSAGSAEIKRRLRLELSHDLGPDELGRDVRKRLVSLRRSTSFVGWRRRKALIKDLRTQADMITDKIAPDDATLAFDLLWQFLELAPSVYERTDDSRGEVGDVFREALAQIGEISGQVVLDPLTLATQVWGAVRDNGYGEFDGIIGIVAPALGQAGFAHLKGLVDAYEAAPLEEDPDHEALRFLRDLRGDGSYLAKQKARLIKSLRQEIAEAEGDTSAYIAQYSEQDLKRPDIAAEVAQLFLDEGKAADALALLQGAEQDNRDYGRNAWDLAYIASLLALDRVDEAQTHRWARFCETLNGDYLRAFLKLLPDFEDIEAEDRARAHALAFDDLPTALNFFLGWPDLASAAKLIQSRQQELDGDLYHIFTPAAEALRDRHPLAAVLLWRAMIDYALAKARTTRYGHAADHLRDCQAADIEITEYGHFGSHEAYLAQLRTRHERKASFWNKLRLD
jgi:hypothetical protein